MNSKATDAQNAAKMNQMLTFYTINKMLFKTQQHNMLASTVRNETF